MRDYAGRNGSKICCGRRSSLLRRHNGRAGFTLIELLIVVVIIGILAAVAIPKFSSTKGKAYLSSMKSDLKNFASAQESYYYDNGVYYAGGVPNANIPFRPTSGVTITVTAGDVGGWAATATHGTVPGTTCSIFVGGAAAPAPATIEGSPACN